MVKKDTIGKIQLVIGIIVLIAAIIGFSIASHLNSNLSNSPYETDYDSLTKLNMSNETKTIIHLENIQLYLSDLYFRGDMILDLILSSSIGIILSLLLITQGLVNMGEKNVIK